MSKPPDPTRCALVAVIGDAEIPSEGVQEALAFAIGQGLIDAGHRLVTGGFGGVMEAAHRGARASAHWHDGAGIGLLSGSDPREANPFVDIAIPTGLDHGRNRLVAQSEAVIAIGGRAGTLSELAFAWIHRRLIIGVRCGGWSARLADQCIDARVRYPDLPEDRVFGADTAAEAQPFWALVARLSGPRLTLFPIPPQPWMLGFTLVHIWSRPAMQIVRVIRACRVQKDDQFMDVALNGEATAKIC